MFDEMFMRAVIYVPNETPIRTPSFKRQARNTS